MKLKHFAGYGTVNVERTGKKPFHSNYDDYTYTLMAFRISGNHEQGLEPRFHDEYTIQHWLKRWTKGYIVTDYWTQDCSDWCNHEEAITLIAIMKEA